MWEPSASTAEKTLRRPKTCGPVSPKVPALTRPVLGQEPLAGLMPTSELLRLAESLDEAGFAYLEVSGGGVFDSAVRRGIESPRERIRALNARTKRARSRARRGR